MAYSIAMICLGNICRSPTAEVVLSHKLDEAGLGDRVRVRSAGTGDWHIGEQMDRRAAATLAANGYDPSRHRATQIEAAWLEEDDLVLVMDRQNLRDVQALAPVADGRVLMFRTFDPLVHATTETAASPREDPADALDVPDPWYAGQDSFDLVLAIVERTSDTLVEALTALLADDVR